MKRVAVCISGHLRAPIRGYELFKRRIIDPNPHCQFEFFIDTWAFLDWRANDSADVSRRRTSAVLRDVIDLYRPRSIRVQENMQFDTRDYVGYIRPGDVKKGTQGEHILSMFYKVFHCDEFRIQYEIDNSMVFDAVMRHRTDVAFTDDVILSDDVFAKLQEKKVLVAENRSGQPEWCSDVWALASSRGMSVYTDIYYNIPRLVDEHKVFRPEPLLYYHLSSSGAFGFEEFGPDWFVLKEQE